MEMKIEKLLSKEELEEFKKKALKKLDAVDIKDVVTDAILEAIHQIFSPETTLAEITVRTPALAEEALSNAVLGIDMDLDTLKELYKNIDKEPVPVKLLAGMTLQNGARYIAEFLAYVGLSAYIKDGKLKITARVDIKELTLHDRGDVLAVKDKEGNYYPNLLWEPYENFQGGLSKTMEEIINEILEKRHTTIYTLNMDMEVIKYEVTGFMDDLVLVTDFKAEVIADLSGLDSLILPDAFQNPPAGLTKEILAELLKAARNSYLEEGFSEPFADTIAAFGTPVDTSRDEPVEKVFLKSENLVKDFFDTILQGKYYEVQDDGKIIKLGFDLLDNNMGFGGPAPVE